MQGQAGTRPLSEAIELSIVIPSYERCDSLLRLLTSIEQSVTAGDPIEVVVVLDGSTDGSAEGVAALTPGFPIALRCLWQENTGPSGARNHGLVAARGPICLMVDDDMTIDRLSIETHRQFHRQSATPSVLLGPHVEGGKDRASPARSLPNVIAERNQRLSEQGAITDAFDFWTGVMSVPSETLRRIGAFDEGFRGWGEEDVELGFRVLAAEIPVAFDSRAGARHHRHRRPGDAIRAQRERGRNLVHLCAAHPAALARVQLLTSPLAAAFELGLRNPMGYGLVADASKLALRLRPIRKSRLRRPIFRLGSDAALIAGALDAQAPEGLLQRLTIRAKSFSVDLHSENEHEGAAHRHADTQPSSDLRSEYERDGLIGNCGELADQSLVKALVEDAAWFADEVERLDREGERRVPYRFTPAIKSLVTDANLVRTVEELLGTDRWVAWGPNIQTGVPNAAHDWHTDIESTMWPSLTVAVGLRGCSAHNATRYMPGTHRFASTPLALRDPTDDQLVSSLARHLDDRCGEIVRFDGFKNGAFYVFDARGWHCGDREVSADRMSLYLHYQRADDPRIPYMRDYRRGTWFEEAAPFMANPSMAGDVNRSVHAPPAPPAPWTWRRVGPMLTRAKRKVTRASSVIRRPTA